MTKTRMGVALSIALLYSLLTGGNVKAADETQITTSEKGVVATLRELPEAAKFMECAEKSGMLAKLEGKGPFTILVPTNKVFEAAKEKWQMVKGDSEKEKRFCFFHVLPGNLTPDELKKAESQITLCEPAAGESGEMKMNCVKIFRENKDLIQRQIECTDGRIYLINALLIPPCCEVAESGKIEKIERKLDSAVNGAIRSAEALTQEVVKSTESALGKAMNGNGNGKTNGNGNGNKTPATTPATSPLPDTTAPRQ
ncbi:MAG: fasciclin domain-containing protein [Planctomycetaceae bacterium]|nr:fasciclin domain-containing protein [Planctomycetaceae bacterium]